MEVKRPFFVVVSKQSSRRKTEIMAEEKVNKDELNKLLRQRRLQVNNAKKEIFLLVHHFVGRERNEDSEIDCESLLETLLDTEKEV